jgi:D-serine deaminase-like pyridoxal phosphate-dependent protein
MTVNLSAANKGETLAQVDTPALILDLDAFERNCDRLAQAVGSRAIGLRPHAKSHKCPEIAKRQIARGAVGICCQKVSEAQVFADAGIHDILISNEVVGEKKIARLCELAKVARVSVCVDHLDNASAINAAARAAGVVIPVLIEVDVGAHRCGVAPGAPTLALAAAIQQMPGLAFQGLQAYHGPAQHMRTQSERHAAIGSAISQTRATRDLLLENGIACTTIAGAGTGSFLIEAASDLYTELQVGSYIFMDADYARNDWQTSGMPRFEHSLFVWTSVMSVAGAAHAVVDAGLKASSVDSGMPVVADYPGAKFVKASDEHGVLTLDPSQMPPLALGSKLKLIPGHCDPTVNLYNDLVVIQNNTVVDIWPIAARGALL